MSGVHPVAARGFSRSPDAYERARPDYPAAAIDFLALRLGLRPGRRVLDLAAGTGKLTRPLLGTGTDVVAVEPVAQMRAALPPEAHVLEGTAEAIPLPDGSVDAVTVGQAFHWFDGATALAEIHRVLRPGGKLALIWNSLRKDTSLGRAIESIIEPHRGDSPGHRTSDWRPAFEHTRLFGPLEERHFPNDQELDADGLVDRFRSTSFVAVLDPALREAVLGDVRALAAGGPVTVRYDTEVHLCERRP